MSLFSSGRRGRERWFHGVRLQPSTENSEHWCSGSGRRSKRARVSWSSNSRNSADIHVINRRLFVLLVWTTPPPLILWLHKWWRSHAVMNTRSRHFVMDVGEVGSEIIVSSEENWDMWSGGQWYCQERYLCNYVLRVHIRYGAEKIEFSNDLLFNFLFLWTEYGLLSQFQCISTAFKLEVLSTEML